MTHRKWQRRYEVVKSHSPSCPPHISKRLEAMVPKSMLDVACGDGAVALAAARLGWKVTAIDISPAALQRLREFAETEGLAINTIEADLEGDLLPAVALEYYDLITVCRYKPIAALYAWCADRLAPDGCFLLSTFNINHHHRTGFNRRFVLEERELCDIEPRLACQFYGAEGETLAFDTYAMVRA